MVYFKKYGLERGIFRVFTIVRLEKVRAYA